MSLNSSDPISSLKFVNAFESLFNVNFALIHVKLHLPLTFVHPFGAVKQQ